MKVTNIAKQCSDKTTEGGIKAPVTFSKFLAWSKVYV